MDDRIRVVLADDHAVVRKGIREFLEESGDVDVIAEADDGADALRLVEIHQPDVAVLDIRMPEVTGVEATRQIKVRFPQVRVLILTAYDDDPYVFALLQAGADGYVLKTASGDELVRAVRTVHRGESALSPEIAGKVVRQAISGRPESAADQVETLTDREFLAFTGVYAHQREMRDFVAERDLALVRMTARMVEDGLAHGVIGADGSGLAAWLQPLISGQPETAVLIIVDGEGRALTHPDPQQLGADLRDDRGVAEVFQQHPPNVQGSETAPSPGSGGAVIVADGEEEPVLVAFAPVGGTDWVVLVQEPVEGLIGPILRLSSLAPIVAIGAGVLSLLILTFGWRTIVRPLQRLAQAAEQVSWGDFSAISQPASGVQEVQDLHQALAEMVERIRGYEAGMRDYLGAVTRGQEAERARLARELHDGPVQELIALGQRAEMAQRLMARSETERAQALMEELRRAELETVAELRRIIGALRPIYLDDLGFLPALEMLVQQTVERTTARIRLEKGDTVHRCTPAVELAAYRIAQEALNNAIQHAHAQNIVVRVRCDTEKLTLSVADDGVGFVLPQRPDFFTQAGHFGLVGMQERATRLDGTIQIRTTPGEGTQITVQLPDQPAKA
jgi:signal transduction histidine kinase/DNA-binding NarL/FixJ family response regulator